MNSRMLAMAATGFGGVLGGGMVVYFLYKHSATTLDMIVVGGLYTIISMLITNLCLDTSRANG